MSSDHRVVDALLLLLMPLLTEQRYCFGMEIPPDIMAEDDMKAVWSETNVIISTYVFVYH